MIDLKNVNKVYKTGKIDFLALRDINLFIDKGDFVALTGPSGSGKSTLMNLIGCLDKVSGGNYYLDQKDVSKLSYNALSKIRNKKLGFVFQSFNLLPSLTARENIELPMVYAGVKAKIRKERSSELLDEVGLLNWAEHKPKELSGGQQQRVAVARALVMNPPVILADEPTGNLDSKSGKEIMNIFMRLWKAGSTIVMVTHDRDIASMSKRQIYLKDGIIQKAS